MDSQDAIASNLDVATTSAMLVMTEDFPFNIFRHVSDAVIHHKILLSTSVPYGTLKYIYFT